MFVARRLSVASRPLLLPRLVEHGGASGRKAGLGWAWGRAGRRYYGPRTPSHDSKVRFDEKGSGGKALEAEARAFGALERFRKEGELEKMLQRLMQYLEQNKRVSQRMFVSVLTAFVDSARKVDARRLLADRARFGLQGLPSAAEEELMLKLECKVRDRASAMRRFESMGRGGRRRSLRAYGMLLTVLAKEGDAMAAEELIAGMNVDCVQPDRVAWNLVLQAHAHSGGKDGAESVVERMEEAQCKADKRTYRHLVCAFVNAGDLEGAEKVLEEKLHETDGVAVAHLIRGMCKAGRTKEAEAMVIEMARLANADKAHRVARLDAAAAAVLEHGWLPLKNGRRAASLVLEKLPALRMQTTDRMMELAQEACAAAGESKKRREVIAKQRLLRFREEEKAAKRAR